MTERERRDHPVTTERIAKIESTTLGYEDHGILTGYLHLSYGDSSQGAGGYDLGFGNMCAQFVAGVIKACAAPDWESLRGRTVIAVIEGGLVRGIKPLPTERGAPFMFNEISEEGPTHRALHVPIPVTSEGP